MTTTVWCPVCGYETVAFDTEPLACAKSCTLSDYRQRYGQSVTEPPLMPTSPTDDDGTLGALFSTEDHGKRPLSMFARGELPDLYDRLQSSGNAP